MNFIQNSLHMIFKPPLYLLPCSCTSQIHASSSFNHTPTCFCLFIKCRLHGLEQAEQLRLATFQTHTCIWDASDIFQGWCVSVSVCSMSIHGEEGAGSKPPHIGVDLKLHTFLQSPWLAVLGSPVRFVQCAHHLQLPKQAIITVV